MQLTASLCFLFAKVHQNLIFDTQTGCQGMSYYISESYSDVPVIFKKEKRMGTTTQGPMCMLLVP